MGIYSIKSGDTIFGIAKANNTTVDAIKKANPKLNIDKIFSGQKINLPNSSAKTDTFQKTTTSQAKPNSYTIKKGDTLEKIAQQYFIPLEDLKNANSNVNAANLKIGQNIKIPEKKAIISQVNEKDENFKSVLSKILKDEGGFKPAEKDGSDVKTNKGITQDVYNKFKNKGYVKSIKY